MYCFHSNDIAKIRLINQAYFIRRRMFVFVKSNSKNSQSIYKLIPNTNQTINNITCSFNP